MTSRSPLPAVPRPVRPSSQPATRKGILLSPLAQKMLHDMQLAGLGERTHESYLRGVRKFTQWLQKFPDVASENDLRRYLFFIKNGNTRGRGSFPEKDPRPLFAPRS